MSFSQNVKDELLGCIPAARHCQLAELYAFFLLLGGRMPDAGEAEQEGLSFVFEHDKTAQKVFTLLERAFKIDVDCVSLLTRGGRVSRFSLEIRDPQQAEAVRKALSHPSVLGQQCCKNAFLRGAFLASGSLSAPEKYYHYEIVCPDEVSSKLVCGTIRNLGVEARSVVRKKDHVVYVKGADGIGYLLGAMGASISFLNIETIRVEKEVRGVINRQVNCETANLNKTVVSAVRQINDILFLKENNALADLTPALQQMAELRLEYRDVPLSDLGALLDPPVGKSGVNHRLRKLTEIASELREKMNGSVSVSESIEEESEPS